LWNVGTALRYIILPVNTLRHSDVVVNYCTFDWRQFLLKHWSRIKSIVQGNLLLHFLAKLGLWIITYGKSVSQAQWRGGKAEGQIMSTRETLSYFRNWFSVVKWAEYTSISVWNR